MTHEMGPTTHPLYEMIGADRQGNQGGNYSSARRRPPLAVFIYPFKRVMRCDPVSDAFFFSFLLEVLGV
jgi:hypothetical protein